MLTDEEKGAKLIGEIAQLAVLINQTTDYAVWIEVNGHVSWTDIRIARSKTDYNDVVHKSGPKHLKPALERLMDLRDKLQSLYETKDIDASLFEARVSTEEVEIYV